MSRPLRLTSLFVLFFSLACAGCKTSTPYARRYAPGKNYFVAPPEKRGKTAEDLIKATEVPGPGAPAPGLPDVPPPPIPGLVEPPPAAPEVPAPAVDPLAPAPAPAAPPL